MADVRIERLADLVISYSLGVKKNELVQIAGDVSAEPFIRETIRLALNKGAHVMTRVGFPWQDEMFFKTASDSQLEYINPVLKFQVEHIKHFLGIVCSSNSKRLTRVEPEKMAKANRARYAVNERFMERAAAKDLMWCGVAYPGAGEAQDAEMGIEAWENFVFESCLCDKPNPVKRWKEVSKRQDEMTIFLNKAKNFKIEADGTDLTISAAGRKWINCDGKYNMPDGEVFTAPVEDSAEGKIKYIVPTVYGGREVNNIELTFKKGKVIKAKATKGEEYLNKMIDMDEGGRYLGEFAIGTNFGIKDYTKNILFDEKIGGTVHLALGRCYEECGGTNKSALHWDMICDLRKGGTLTADGKKIVEDGVIKI